LDNGPAKYLFIAFLSLWILAAPFANYAQASVTTTPAEHANTSLVSDPLPVVGIWSTACGSSNITVTNPACGPLSVGSTISAEVNVTNAPTFNAYEFSLYFDTHFIQWDHTDTKTGTIFANPFTAKEETPVPGTYRLVVINAPGNNSAASGILAHVLFKVQAVGVSPIALAAGMNNPSTFAADGAWTRLVIGNTPIDTTTTDGYFKNDIRETVVYDSNNNDLFDTGETVIAGNTPPVGTALKADLNLTFVDLNSNGLWESGETVVYDSGHNGVFDTGKDVVLVGSAPVNQTALVRDPKVKYVDSNSNNHWDDSRLGPVALFTYSPLVLQAGATATFDATTSYDPDTPPPGIANYVWDFGAGGAQGGGVSSQTATVTHSFGATQSPLTGNFSIRLTVVDRDNNFTGTKTQRVYVAQIPFHDIQLASLTALPSAPHVGDKVAITAVIKDLGTFDEQYNFTLTYGPPTTTIDSKTNQLIPKSGTTSSTISLTYTLDTAGLATGAYEVDASVAIPVDSNLSNNMQRQVITIIAQSSSQYVYLLVGAVVVAAAIVTVGLFLRKRRRRPEQE